MKRYFLPTLCLALSLFPVNTSAQPGENAKNAGPSVTVAESMLVMPAYEHVGREMEPPLFPSSTLTGLYPFTTYQAPYQEGDPKPKTYRTIVVENEYLKLTYIPEFGGRFFSVYDKLRKREAFYRNDVIKPANFNPRFDWPVGGLELTGPYDAHTLTQNSEPYWSHTAVRQPDGSVSLVLGEIDPVYHMKVNLTATLHPGIAALEISVFCFNPNDAQMPQMFWINSGFPATEKTRFIYPMTRTVGHTTGEVSDWPLYNGIDYSWDRNNKHMLGVFGIDSYDNFAGSYQFDNDYGVFRFADRRVVQGMKLWTFGYGPIADETQRGYTDHAGPYVEVQSGRHVWDGHYEWVAPHKAENWSEWWIPVGGIGGVTTMTRDVALNLTATPDAAGANSAVTVALSPASTHKSARLVVTAQSGELLSTEVDLVPGMPVLKSITAIHSNAEGLRKLTVRLNDKDGTEILNYVRPDENPGRKEYSPFARALEDPPVPVDRMSVEELVEAAEFKLKEVDPASMQELVERALKKDPGYSRAHLLLGINDYVQGRYKEAIDELSQATRRDPYSGEGWYYLAISQLAVGNVSSAERVLYYVGSDSSYFGGREYQLGKIALLAGKMSDAEQHLRRAGIANGYDQNARALLALTLRETGQKEEASRLIEEAIKIDPADRLAYAEKYLLDGSADARRELLRLLGSQSQEALDLSFTYAGVHRWKEAASILELVAKGNQDPWGTSPLYYYTLAYDLKQSGETNASSRYLAAAQAAAGIVDRFPYRRESEAPLADAVATNPKDAVARYNLACLLYFLGRPQEAIGQWEAAVALEPESFSDRRALGLAYAEQGKTSDAALQLEKAVDLNPKHTRTIDDLSGIYARAGKFEEQVALISKALARSPGDDDLEIALLNAYLIQGRYEDGDTIVNTYKFSPRHRSTILRDEYRNLRYGMGAAAFNKGDYPLALSLFQSALKPPASLGVDDFQFQSAPRAHYYIARTLEAMGREQEAKAAYQESIRGVDLLSGDRDSWNSDNFYLVLSLEKLGMTEKALSLIPHFDGFARTEMDETNRVHRGQARLLLALIAKHDGQTERALRLFTESLQALPDSLPPRYELRGDVLDPLVIRESKQLKSN